MIFSAGSFKIGINYFQIKVLYRITQTCKRIIFISSFYLKKTLTNIDKIITTNKHSHKTKKRWILRQLTKTMSYTIILSLHTISVELIYRILDKLDDFTLICSMYNVCTRLNAVMDTYRRAQVKLNFSCFYIRYISTFKVYKRKDQVKY